MGEKPSYEELDYRNKELQKGIVDRRPSEEARNEA